jgi:hypothetical protein
MKAIDAIEGVLAPKVDRADAVKSWEPTKLVLEATESKNFGSRICKPNFVRGIAPAGRPFLWAAHYCTALATYPEV